MFSLDVFDEAVVLSSIVTTDVTGEGLVLVFLSSVMSEGDLVNCHEVAGVTGVADPLMDGLDMLVQMTLTLAREPALVAEISLALVPVLSLDVNPQLELIPLKLALLASQPGGAVGLLLVENQQSPGPELLAAVREDAAALEYLAVAGGRPVGVGSLLPPHQWRKTDRQPRVIFPNVAPAARLLGVNLVTVRTGLDEAFVLQLFVNSDQVNVGVSEPTDITGDLLIQVDPFDVLRE